MGTSFDRRFGTPPPSSYLLGTGVCYKVCGSVPSTGIGHSLVLSEARVVYSFGFGDGGKLGHGDEEDQLTPKAIDMSGSGPGDDTDLA